MDKDKMDRILSELLVSIELSEINNDFDMAAFMALPQIEELKEEIKPYITRRQRIEARITAYIMATPYLMREIKHRFMMWFLRNF